MADYDYDVFLSHSSCDKSVVEQLARQLREVGLRPFLDSWHLVPGRPWQEALEFALQRSETVAVFVGPSGLGPWHNEEIRTALDRAVRAHDDTRVIPVVLPGADMTHLPPFVARRTAVDFREGFDDTTAFSALVAGIRGEAPAEPAATLPDEPAPYPSLLSFTAQNAHFFFGREEETDRLLARVRRSPFTAVVGASGSGKSSLVLAGLLPAIDRDWRALVLIPGTRPLRTLADQLATLTPTAGRLPLADDLEARFLARSDSLAIATSTLLAGQDVAMLLLVIDQFEEIFTSAIDISEAARRRVQRAFIGNLTNAAQTCGGRIRVVITLRADFWQNCLEFAELRALLEPNQLLLGPMGTFQLRDAIKKPAEAVGAFFERGLVGRLLDDMHDQPAALPLLQAALAQLWRRRHGVWLTHGDYEQIGGVSGAIDQRADEVYRNLTERQQQLARMLFQRLVTLGEGTGDTRRRMRRDELNLTGATRAEIDRLIATLVHRDVRLISTDKDTVELVHEALIECWGQLASWLNENRADLRTHRMLTEAAHEWDKHDLEASYLYGGARLSVTTAWATRHDQEMSELERSFLEASHAHDQQRRAAEEEARIAQERLLAERPLTRAGEALFELEHTPERALLLTLAAALTNAGGSHIVLRIMYRVLDAVLIRRILRGHADRISSVAWHPDGHSIVTGSYDGTARLWDAATGTTVRVLEGHGGPVTCVAWSPDGRLLLTGSWDATARIWDAASRCTVRVLEGHQSWVSSVTWSPSGRWAATGGKDYTARLWDVATGASMRILAGHTEWVRSVEWRPDEREVMTGSYDGTAAVWKVASGKRIWVLEGHSDAVPAVAWSKDGREALTASEDGTVRLWDVKSRETIRVIRVHTSPVYAVAWAPHGRQALTGSEDGVVRIWDVDSGELLSLLPGHTGWVSSVAWRPDGQQVASGSEDATARVSDVQAGSKAHILGRHDHWVSSVSWRPDGQQVATAGGDGVVRLWDTKSSAEIATLRDEEVLEVAWSPDGQQLATGSETGSVKIWDVASRSVIATLSGHTERVSSVAWSSDGRRILTGSRDRTVRLWDAATGINTATLQDNEWICDVAWSPDRQHALIATWGETAYIWDLSGADVRLLTGHTAALHAAAWSPDGAFMLTTSGDGTARIWDIATRSEIRTLRAGEAHTGAWSPDGQLVLTGSRDGGLRIWDVASGADVCILRHPGAVFSAAWSADGRWVLSGSGDGAVRLWATDSKTVIHDLMQHVCGLFPDDEIRQEVSDWRGCDAEIKEP